MGYEWRMRKLKKYVKGWIAYYLLVNMKRRKLMNGCVVVYALCIWKSWKKLMTRTANLIKCGIPNWKAYEWGGTRLGFL